MYQKEYVCYFLRLDPFPMAPGLDYKTVVKTSKDLLDNIAREVTKKYKEITITDILVSATALGAVSEKEDFERLFNVKVVGQTIEGTPKIPNDLEKLVRYVELDKDANSNSSLRSNEKIGESKDNLNKRSDWFRRRFGGQ